MWAATPSGDNAAAVTTSDSTVISPGTRGLYVGGAGDVKVDMLANGSGVIFKAVPVGTYLPIRVVKVYATGTTATNIVAIF